MTAETLELRRKLDLDVSKLSDIGLKKVYEYTQMVLLWMLQFPENHETKPILKTPTIQETSKEKKFKKKVWYNGKLYNELTVKFLSGKVNTDTDEERDEKIWEYLQEKYGKL